MRQVFRFSTSLFLLKLDGKEHSFIACDFLQKHPFIKPIHNNLYVHEIKHF